MSDNDIKIEVIKRTQDTLGKYVKKPVLSEKLLKKPPFRFLHDVFNAVIKSTGYFEGLYTQQELNYENIKNREDKIQFLHKMIEIIKIMTNTPLKVRPSKIVAGHEPEYTNELLYLIGDVIEKQKDWKTAVKKHLSESNNIEYLKPDTIIQKETENSTKVSPTNGKPHHKKTTKSNPVKKPNKANETLKKTGSLNKSLSKTNSENEYVRIKKQSSIKETPSRGNSIDSTKTKKQLSIQGSVSRGNSVDSTKNIGKKTKSFEKEENLIKNSFEENENNRKKDNMQEEKKEPEPEPQSKPPEYNYEVINGSPNDNLENSLKLEFKENVTKENVFAKPTQTIESTNNKELVTREEAKENKTAFMKKENTFTREDSTEITKQKRTQSSLRPPSARPSSARPGAPRRRDKNVEIVLQPNDPITMSGINVNLQSFCDLEDDGENLVVIENSTNQENTEITSNSINENLKQGHLVQQILKTQKELTNLNPENTEMKKNIPVHTPHQINTLSNTIQSLTKIVNPLGKLMDFIPEDIDAMQIELNMWHETYSLASQQLTKERILTENATEPMKNQLLQLEDNVKSYCEMINSSRVKILQNSDKILKLLKGE